MTHNELLAEFMGYEVVTVGYSGTNSETQWQRDNEQFMEDIGIRSVGKYAIHKLDNSWEEFENLNYNLSWDCLIPVCAKWDSIPFEEFSDLERKRYLQLCDDLDNSVSCYEITYAYDQLVKNIKWYNEKNQKNESSNK